MLLLLDTDGGEKKFNSLLIYSLPTKISVNVNYPNHFHVWRMKTEKSECLYFLLVEERELQILSVPSHHAFFSPSVLSFSMKLPLSPAWTQTTHTRQSRRTLQHVLPPHSSELGAREETLSVSHPSHGAALGSRLLLSALRRAKKAPSCQGWGWKELCHSGRRALGWIQSCRLRFFPGDFS